MSIINRIKANNIFGGKVHFIILIIIAVSLPLSPFVLSMAQIWLAMNYLLEGKYKEKINQIGKDRTLWLFLTLPLVHVLWLMNTSDFQWAGHDLVIKLPLLSFPVILATTKPLSALRLKIVMWFFVAAVFAGTMASMLAKAGYIDTVSSDHRGISIFVSHIRFSLMIVFAVFFIVTNLLNNFKSIPTKGKIISLILIIWFIIFLAILKVLSSWVLLVLLSIFITFSFLKIFKSITAKTSSILFAIAIPAVLFIYIQNIYYDFHGRENINLDKLPTHSASGNEYHNNTKFKVKENGNYTYILIAYSELEESWNSRSSIPFTGNTTNGHSIKHTLVRFMTSKGYTKDSTGVSKLTDKEIEAIENGITNCIYLEKSSVYTKIYEVIWEMHLYSISNNASGMSIPMRIEFFRAGMFLLKDNLLTGTGTGDIKQEYKTAYSKTGSSLKKEYYHLRAHNQFLTFLITFGIFGGFIAIIAMFAPYFMVKNKSLLLTCFFIIIFISMISEDTLETQAGVTFYSLFYPFLIYNNKQLL